MKKSKIIAFSILSLLGVGLCTGNVLAAYAITDNADSFEITITTTVAPKTVTFHTPDADDNTCSTYNTTPVEVEYGQTLNDISASVPNTANFLGFTFNGWYLENTFENSFLNSNAIQSNIDLYANYTRSNVLYDGATYYASSNGDQTVDAQYVYKVSSQTWGVASTSSMTNENKIDLISASGIYKMTYSANWTIKRKVGVNAKDSSFAWGDANADTYVYGLNDDHNSYSSNTYAWGANPSDNHEKVTNSSKATFYIDYSYTYLGALRNDPAVSLDLSSANPWTSTKHTPLKPDWDSRPHYTKDNIYLYIPSNLDTIPYWGNGD